MGTETVVYTCPVDGCSFSCREEQQFIGHMAGTMQADDAHRWENVPVDHHDVSSAAERIEHTSLQEWGA